MGSKLTVEELFPSYNRKLSIKPVQTLHQLTRFSGSGHKVLRCDHGVLSLNPAFADVKDHVLHYIQQSVSNGCTQRESHGGVVAKHTLLEDKVVAESRVQTPVQRVRCVI